MAVLSNAIGFWRSKFYSMFSEEDGMGVVEVILIIIVLIGLVVLFQNQITSVVNSILKTVSTNAGKVK